MTGPDDRAAPDAPEHDLIDTVKTPDPELDAGRNVEEKGEPFENVGGA